VGIGDGYAAIPTGWAVTTGVVLRRSVDCGDGNSLPSPPTSTLRDGLAIRQLFVLTCQEVTFVWLNVALRAMV
jgi:hypothetical protein